MTESCHFNDKNSLGGSFCIWKGGSIMATTRIMPLHVGKGRTESRAISDIIDYVALPRKQIMADSSQDLRVSAGKMEDR